MFHQQLIVLIITIFLCSLNCSFSSTSAQEFRENEKFVTCGWANQATCENKKASGEWVCKDQWICAEEWLVRNDAGVCVPLWQCPDFCPEKSKFRGCTSNVNIFPSITVAEFTEQCKPVCICKKGYAMDHEKNMCIRVVPTATYFQPLHGR